MQNKAMPNDSSSLSCINHHRVVAVELRALLRHGDAATTAGQQLAPDLGANGGVTVRQQKVKQSLALIFRDRVMVALGKEQEALVPDNGRDGRGAGAEEVDDESIDDLGS